MYRGTTPSVTFKVKNDFDLNDMTQIWVTFKSHDAEVTYELDDLNIDYTNNTIKAYMSQEDTLAFVMKNKFIDKVEAQVRFLRNDNKAFASNIVTVSMLRILKEGVIEE